MKMMKTVLAVAMLLLSAAALPAQDIFEAVKANDPVKVKALIEKDAALVKAQDEAGNTPLHHAAIIGSSALAELLLASGADINAVNLQLNTPLHEAIRAKKVEVARLLIEKGTDIHKQNISQKSPLHFAAQYDQMEIGKLLIAKGATIDARDDYLRTPFLLVARQTGNVDFGKLLQKHGADINAQDKYGDRPLNLAAWRGWKGFIDWLLDLGADFDTRRDVPLQMLGFAADCGSLRLFNVVLQKCGDLFADEAKNRGTMRRAIAGGSVEIVKALLDRKIPLVTQADAYGWTPAHAAAANGHWAMIAFLAEQGMDLNVRTKSGKTAYNLAVENDRREVLDLLTRLKADTSPQKFPELKGPYYGQALPEHEMLLFAADIVSSPNGDDNHGSITFTPDGKEIYWNLRSKIWTARLEDGRWAMPGIVLFSQESGLAMDDNPFITPDGKRMFFTSNRPGSVSQDKENIWYVERTPDGWGQPRPVSAEVNALPLHWGISVAASGALYFGGIAPEGYGSFDIYCSRLEKGNYANPVNLGPVINGKGSDHCPYIAPDESYIIFSRMGDEEEGIYISYRNKDGKWMPPQKLYGELQGVCPTVTPDGKYLFILSDGVYWLPAAFIEELRPMQQRDFPKLTGLYLGQKPPDDTPEIFAPGIISTADHEYGISFSMDLKKIYLKRIDNGTRKNLVFSCENDMWRGPEDVKFEVEGDFGQLFVMSDGNHLLANHITRAADGDSLSTIVRFSRKNGVWGDPVTIGPGMRATSTKSGHIYVTHVLDSKKSFGAIGRYKYVGGKYEKIEVLGDEINHKDFSSAHPFVAPDESYLIFDSKREGDDRGGLYISFNQGGGSWSKAISLSEKLHAGKNAHDWYATVSPDGQYLFFSSGQRGQSDIYWVSAKIIEELRPKR